MNSCPTVTVCRGCCCGTPKVSRLDHTAQLADLRQSLARVATIRTSTCLDACEHANVIVIQPSAQGRQAGGRPVWLGLWDFACRACAVEKPAVPGALS